MTGSVQSTSAGRRTALVVGGVIVLAIVAGLLLALALNRSPELAAGGASATPMPSETAAPSAVPSPSATPPSATPAPSASPRDVVATPAATPSARPAIDLDTVVATTVERLALRREPGTNGERLGVLALGTDGFVTAGPELVDGIPWYRVSGMGVPYASGCVTTPPDEPIVCPAYHGWVAGEGPDGAPWLEPTDGPRCPEAPASIESISEVGFTLRLICWGGGQELSFRAWWPTIPEDAGLGGMCEQADHVAGFLVCEHVNYNALAAYETEGFYVQRLLVAIDPRSGVTMPERGQWIQVTGHFDDPMAQQCADAMEGSDEDLDSVVFRCRLQFVPTEVTVAAE